MPLYQNKLLRKWLAIFLAISAAAPLFLYLIPQPLQFRIAMISLFCLALWLSELVPAYVPTLALWALAAVFLGSGSSEYSLGEILKFAADPVLILFLGGFTFSVAAARYKLDIFCAKFIVDRAGGSRINQVIFTAFATAFMSMWISNIAAAAMMLAALAPILDSLPNESNFRRALLLSLAIGANFGGIATPISSGPNGIAMAEIAKWHSISFSDWMLFCLPIAAGLIAASLIFIALRYKVSGNFLLPGLESPKLSGRAKLIALIFAAAILAWLTEPFHHIPSAVISLVSVALLFGTGLLKRDDLNRIDWGTLALIAGGITLGRLLEKSGLLMLLAENIPWFSLSIEGKYFILCLLSAILAALMSNTATAAIMIPLASSLIPSPATPVIIAVSTSLGMCFVISTPPNVITHGKGGVKSSDFLIIGIAAMIGGSLLLAFTGARFLRFWFP